MHHNEEVRAKTKKFYGPKMGRNEDTRGGDYVCARDLCLRINMDK
jgi:hypothetical protein